MKRIIKKILLCTAVIIMAFLLAFENFASIIGAVYVTETTGVIPITGAAASRLSTYYIKEIRIGSYTALKAEGYIVDKESATNRYYDENGNLQYCGDMDQYNGYGYCIGYKLTTDKNDAIYDISVMDMYGKYNEMSYREVLVEQQKEMLTLAKRVQAVAEKVNAQNKAGSKYAALALETLNNMTIDVERDVGDSTEVYEYKLGDFISGKCGAQEVQDYLDMVFLCSTSTTGLIYSQLTQGVFDDITNSSATSWLDRLCENGPYVLTDEKGNVITDTGILNDHYCEDGLDLEYLESAKEIYRTVKDFIDNYLEAKKVNSDGISINTQTVDNASKVNDAQAGNRDGTETEFTETEQSSADAVDAAMYLAIFEALNSRKETVYDPDPVALGEFLDENGCETVDEYLAAVAELVELGVVTQADYEADKIMLDKLQNGYTVTGEPLYPYGTNSDGTQRTIAEFFLEACTVNPASLIYQNDLYRPFYTFLMENEDGVAPLNTEQETMFYLCGFNNAAFLGVDPLDLETIRASVKEEMTELKKETGLSLISIYYDVDTTLLKNFHDDTGIYWTSSAARIMAAEERYDLLTQASTSGAETAIDKINKGIKILNLVSTCIGGVGGIISLILGKCGFLAAGVTAKAVAVAFFTGQAAVYSTGTVIFSVIGTVMGWIAIVATIIVLIMTVLKGILEDLEPEYYELDYTEIPQCIYDYKDCVVLEGAAVRYYPVQTCSAEAASYSPDGTGVFAYYRNIRTLPWVCLYYTKDPAAASEPITVDYVDGVKQTIPFVSYIEGSVYVDNYWVDFQDPYLQRADHNGDKLSAWIKKNRNCVKRYIYLSEYYGSAIEGIQGCEPFSTIEGGDGYSPIHAFDEATAYNFAYYSDQKWLESFVEKLVKTGNLTRVMKWYMHRPSVYSADTGDNRYLKDVMLCSDADAEVAKNEIIKTANYTLIDVNLTPNSNQFTYLGYSTTSLSTEAIVDLRWAYYPCVDPDYGSMCYGGKTYSACGSIGNLVLFEAANGQDGTSTAGTPILINGPSSEENPNGIKGRGLIVTTELHSGDGYEPVNLFCGGPALDTDSCGDWNLEFDSEGNMTSSPAESSNFWGSHIYVYFYPETTYTDGPEYLGGLAFFSGRDYGNDHQVITYMQDMGWSLLSGIDVSGHTYLMDVNKTYIAYSVTHNPYRAIYGIVQYTAENNASGMQYCITAGTAGSYCVCEVFQQGGEGLFTYNERSMRMSHAYRTGSYWDGALTDGSLDTEVLENGNVVGTLTRFSANAQVNGIFREAYTLTDGKTIAFRQVTKAGLYVVGNTTTDIKNASPILASELIASDSAAYNSSSVTPVRSITDWYAEEPANLGYVSAYSSDVYSILKDSRTKYSATIFEHDYKNPDETYLYGKFYDNAYNIDQNLLENGTFNLYKDEHLYLFIKRADTARPYFVSSVTVAYAGDNSYTDSDPKEAVEDLMNRAPVDETIIELVSNGPGQLIRLNLTASKCDEDTDYYESCYDTYIGDISDFYTNNVLRDDTLVPIDMKIGKHNLYESTYDTVADSCTIPILKNWRSDEVAYIWVTYTDNSVLDVLSDIRIYETDAETYKEDGVPKELVVDTGAEALVSGDSFRWNGKYYTLYSITGLGKSITDFKVDKNVFLNDEWTACSTDGKASSYTEYFFHLKQYKSYFSQNYIAISSIVKNYDDNEFDAQIGLLNKGCRYIYPVNLKAASGGALYIGYKTTSSMLKALSNVVLQNNGQDSTVTKLNIGSDEYIRLTDDINRNAYDAIVDFYGTSSLTKAKSAVSDAGRYLTNLIFWSDQDFWKLFTGTDAEAEAKVQEYLKGLSDKDREYLEYYLYTTTNKGEKKLLKYSAVTDVYGNIIDCNLTSTNFASDSATGKEVYIFACYSDNTIVTPRSLVGAFFGGSSDLWVISITAVALSFAAGTVLVLKKRRRKEPAAV